MQASFIDDAVRNDREIRPFKMVCEASADITWYRVPGSAWTAAAVRARLDEARRWFDRYCVHLRFEEFSLDLTDKDDRKIDDDLKTVVTEYRTLIPMVNRGAASPERLMDQVHLWLMAIRRGIARKVGDSRLIVLFLDEWYVLVGVDAPSHWRQSRVSANDGMFLLIGLNRYDTGSPHILTHELAHALRKRVNGDNSACIRKFTRTNRVRLNRARPWQDHYSGHNQDHAMTFVTRDNQFERFEKADSCVLSLLEYLEILRAAYVTTTDGCQCEDRARRREVNFGKRRRNTSSKRPTDGPRSRHVRRQA